MTAEIISVGTELLLGDIVDTNAAALGAAFAEHGITHVRRQTVGDCQERITEAIQLSLSRADAVFLIGGLGPTDDDLTRESIAEALGEELVRDEQVEGHLRQMIEKRGGTWVNSLLKQANRPASARVIGNKHGTAPGIDCSKDGKRIVAMPGPKNEFLPMLSGPVAQILMELGGGCTIKSRLIKTAGSGESMLADKVKDLMLGDNPTLAPYAKTGEVHFRITAAAPSPLEADALIEPLEKELVERLGSVVYGTGDDTLAESVLGQLVRRGEKLGVAESCTGGGLGMEITAVPGSSAAFNGSIVSYSNEVKVDVVGVKAQTIDQRGAVSEDCAREMAIGAKEKLAADWGLSITGVAGPHGGTEAKPVGLIYIGCSGPEKTVVVERHFRGTREGIRAKARSSALALLRSQFVD
jgi:nicotinamide-nucleotide amidase